MNTKWPPILSSAINYFLSFVSRCVYVFFYSTFYCCWLFFQTLFIRQQKKKIWKWSMEKMPLINFWLTGIYVIKLISHYWESKRGQERMGDWSEREKKMSIKANNNNNRRNVSNGTWSIVYFALLISIGSRKRWRSSAIPFGFVRWRWCTYFWITPSIN